MFLSRGVYGGPPCPQRRSAEHIQISGLGMEANISTELAAILLTMSRTWTALAGQIALYEAILKEGK
jgi:hypothetical protein